MSFDKNLQRRKDENWRKVKNKDTYILTISTCLLVLKLIYKKPSNISKSYRV